MKKLKCQNLDILSIKDKRFKITTLGIKFYEPFNEKFYAERILLTKILRKSNKMFKTEEAFEFECEDLYKAFVNSNYYCNGLLNSFSFQISFLDNQYIKEEDYLKRIVNMFITSLLEPDLTTNKLELEKSLLIEDIKQKENNKNSYATKRFLELMFDKEDKKLIKSLTISDIEKVTIETLKDSYQDLLKVPCFLFILGNADHDKITTRLNEYTSLKSLVPYPTSLVLPCFYSEIYRHEKVIEKTEIKNVSQAFLCMGFKPARKIKPKERLSLAVFNLILGGTYSSLLVAKIRDELSLAYSVRSTDSITSQTFSVFAGISKENSELVKTIVLDVIDKIKKEDYSIDYLNIAKNKLKSDVLASRDDRYSELNDAIHRKIYQLPVRRIDTVLNKIDAITKKEVANIALIFTLDTVYLLRGDDDE